MTTRRQKESERLASTYTLEQLALILALEAPAKFTEHAVYTNVTIEVVQALRLKLGENYTMARAKMPKRHRVRRNEEGKT